MTQIPTDCLHRKLPAPPLRHRDLYDHLRKAVASLRPGLETSIVAMTDNGHAYDYPPGVRLEIEENKIEDYAHAADVLNRGRYDVVSLQHEFGIFGGEAGEHILTLLNRVTMPVVTTLHTVLSQPSRVQRGVTGRIIDVSSGLVVMSEKDRERPAKGLRRPRQENRRDSARHPRHRVRRAG